MPTISFTRALARFLTVPFGKVEAPTVADAFSAVFASRSTLRRYVLDDQGALRRHIIVYVNGRPVNDRIGLQDPVGPQDEIYVFQAWTGG